MSQKKREEVTNTYQFFPSLELFFKPLQRLKSSDLALRGDFQTVENTKGVGSQYVLTLSN